MPRDQGCCGAITIHAGEMERGRALAKRNIAAFERSGADVYVINAAGCGSALKEYGAALPRRSGLARRARVAFSAKVRDITEYLDEIGLGAGLGPVNGRRHLSGSVPSRARAAHHRGAAPACSRRFPGLELREMEESSLCCGSAGIYNVTQPEMAGRLGRRKVEHVLEVAPDILVTANPGCALQIANGLRAARPTKSKCCTSSNCWTAPTRTALRCILSPLRRGPPLTLYSRHSAILPSRVWTIAQPGLFTQLPSLSLISHV